MKGKSLFKWKYFPVKSWTYSKSIRSYYDFPNKNLVHNSTTYALQYYACSMEKLEWCYPYEQNKLIKRCRLIMIRQRRANAYMHNRWRPLRHQFLFTFRYCTAMVVGRYSLTSQFFIAFEWVSVHRLTQAHMDQRRPDIHIQIFALRFHAKTWTEQYLLHAKNSLAIDVVCGFHRNDHHRSHWRDNILIVESMPCTVNDHAQLYSLHCEECSMQRRTTSSAIAWYDLRLTECVRVQNCNEINKVCRIVGERLKMCTKSTDQHKTK